MAANDEIERPHNEEITLDDEDMADDQEHLIAKEAFVRKDERRHERATLLNGHANRYLMLLSVALGMICLGLIAALYFATRPQSNQAHSSPIPAMPKTMVKFEPDERFAGPSTQENDQAWGSLTPTSDGFIVIDDPESYDLPPGKQTDKGQVYDISLFHQLHCLSGIRRHLLLLKGSIGRNNTQEIQEILLDPEVPHIYHCFDYIRQALMCAGDMTVEWPREEADGRRFAFDGWGVAHECKSWDAIMSYMADHDVSNGF